MDRMGAESKKLNLAKSAKIIKGTNEVFRLVDAITAANDSGMARHWLGFESHPLLLDQIVEVVNYRLLVRKMLKGRIARPVSADQIAYRDIAEKLLNSLNDVFPDDPTEEDGDSESEVG